MSTACACSSENRSVALSDSETADTNTQEPSQIDWKSIWKPLTAIVGAFLVVYCSLVVVLSTICGMIFGFYFS